MTQECNDMAALFGRIGFLPEHVATIYGIRRCINILESEYHLRRDDYDSLEDFIVMCESIEASHEHF